MYGIKTQIGKNYYSWLIHFELGVMYENASPRLFQTKESATAWAKAAGFKNFKIELYEPKYQKRESV